MPKATSESASYKNISSSTLIASGAGRLLGIFVASSTSGTLKLWDQTSAASPILVNTFSAAAGTFYRIPAKFKTGLYVTTGGTIDCTVFYEQN